MDLEVVLVRRFYPLFVFVALMFSFLFPVEADSKSHGLIDSLTRPQVEEKKTENKRELGVISGSLETQSFVKGDYYYFSFKLDKTHAFKINRHKVEDGIYELARAGEAQIMLTVNGLSQSPVYAEKLFIQESLKLISKDALTRLSWSDYQAEKPE